MKDTGIKMGRIAFTALLLAGVMLFVGFSFTINEKARIFPLIVAVPASVLLLLQLAHDLRPRLSERIPFLREQAIIEIELPDDLKSGEQGGAQRVEGMQEWQVFAWLIGLTASIYLLHYLIVAPLFTFAFLRWQSRASGKLAFSVTAGVWLVLYLMFYHLLRVGA